MKLFNFIVYDLIHFPCLMFGCAFSDVIKDEVTPVTYVFLGISFLWLLIGAACGKPKE